LDESEVERHDHTANRDAEWTGRISFHPVPRNIGIKEGKPHLHTFGDTPCYLDAYCYQFGEGESRFLFGFELRRSLVELVLETQQRPILRIWDKRGLVAKAERLDSSSVRIEYLVRFPFLMVEYREDTPEGRRVWARNGNIVTRGEGVHKGGQIQVTVDYEGWEKLHAKETERRATRQPRQSGAAD
jgi:hypothetical protein